jgi:hypothetical protein
VQYTHIQHCNFVDAEVVTLHSCLIAVYAYLTAPCSALPPVHMLVSSSPLHVLPGQAHRPQSRCSRPSRSVDADYAGARMIKLSSMPRSPQAVVPHPCHQYGGVHSASPLAVNIFRGLLSPTEAAHH